MASYSLESTNGTFFKDGDEVSSRVVGVESQVNRVARYPFTTPAEGASHVEITFYSSGKAAGTAIPVRYYIGTDPESHINAGVNAEYTGELTMGSDGITFTGSADIMLMPNTAYYIFFFPGSAAYGYYNWYKGSGTEYYSTLETSGGAGVIYIGNGTSYDAYQVYIGNGTDWDLYLPYIGNGTSYDLYSG